MKQRGPVRGPSRHWARLRSTAQTSNVEPAYDINVASILAHRVVGHGRK